MVVIVRTASDALRRCMAVLVEVSQPGPEEEEEEEGAEEEQL